MNERYARTGLSDSALIGLTALALIAIGVVLDSR